jgi:Fe-S-cluster containining protein
MAWVRAELWRDFLLKEVRDEISNITTMDYHYYRRTEAIYRDIEAYLPHFAGNACGACHRCCTSEASQGLNALELDYLGDYLKTRGRSEEEALKFSDYVNKLRDSLSGELLFNECPLYDSSMGGCSVYEARPLSCRTYGYFMNENSIHLIPDDCGLKKSTVLYTDESFGSLLPFAMPFFALIFQYNAKVGALGKNPHSASPVNGDMRH